MQPPRLLLRLLQQRLLMLLLLAAACGRFGESCLPSPVSIVSVQESAGVGTLVQSLPAGTASPTFRVNDASFECYVTVNSSGVYLARSVDLENRTACGTAPKPTTKTISVELTCGSAASTLIINIEALDEFDPFFLNSQYNVSVSEATPVNTSIFEFKGQVSDRDVDESRDYSFAIQAGAADKFTMQLDGATTGIVRVNSALDFDAGPASRQYRVNISATTLNSPKKTAFTLLAVTVTDFDDLSPRFTSDTYRLSFVENDTSMINRWLSTTPELQASDLDLGINHTIRYSIQSGNSIGGSPFLEINSVTGQFKITRLVDREALTTSELLLQVKANQVDKPDTRIALATVVVTVADKNDNHPVISPDSVTVSIAENSKADTFVTRLAAADADTNSSFTFVMSDASGAFKIDAASGIVTVANSAVLDRESTASLNFTVYAQEASTAEKFRSNNATVTVTITDVNDNSPQFNSSAYRFNVSETAAVGTIIGTVLATDADSGSNGAVQYQLQHASGNGATMFAVNSSTGGISVLQQLSTNPSFVAEYQLVLTATDSATVAKDRRSASSIVQVSVQSAFSSAPQFTRAVFAANITEATPAATDVLRLTATDKDPGSTLTYSLAASNDKFAVTSAGNEGFLRVTGTLDRETQAQYSFTAVVSDGAKTGTAQIQIRLVDFNDNPPRFNASSYNFSVSENSDSGTPLGQVVATDADEPNSANARLQYSLLGEQAAAFFVINDTSGEIKTKAAIDREATPEIRLQVLARDSGSPQLSASVDVIVVVGDVNDNRPGFDASVPSSVTLPEGIKHEDFLQLKFTDADEGANTASLFALVPASSLNNSVIVNSSTGFLSATRPLTPTLFGNRSQHNVTAIVFNTQPLAAGVAGTNSTLTITITLRDVNNNRPIFVQRVFTATIPETLATGSEVLQVKANDRDTSPENAAIVYNITSAAAKFRIDTSGGSVLLAERLDADWPSLDANFTFMVIAYNPSPGSSSLLNDTAQVVITVTDVNDMAPVFTANSYEFSINETASVNSVISSTISASDNDTSPAASSISYELRPASVPFSVNSTTGALSVRASLSRDTGAAGSYVFQVAAVNNASSPQLSAVATVTVRVANVNNNAPLFGSAVYNFTLDENQRPGATVGVVTASDADGDSLTFTVIDNSQFGTSGSTVVTRGSLDRESIAANPIEFRIRASDSVNSATATVRVTVADVNDNAPKFVPDVTSLAASVQESAATGTHIVKLNATDADSGQNAALVFSFLTNSPQFGIANTTGLVTVANASLLDYQQQQQHTLIVACRDQGSPAQTSLLTLIVSIADTNDKPVRFSPNSYAFSAVENVPAGQTLGRVFASDPDTVPKGLTFDLPVPADAARFFITADAAARSAVLSVNASLDREREAVIRVQVRVSDGRFTDLTTVNVTVTDVNDNAPVFTDRSKRVFMDASQPLNTPFATIVATDADDGRNGQVVYLISGGDSQFDIDFSTGNLSLKQTVNASVKSVYNIQVTARDQGSPSQLSVTNVTIFVNASNAHAPIFNPSVYSVTVNESAVVNESLVTLVATDADAGPNGEVSYRILSGNVGNALRLDSSSGQLSLNRSLDFESVKQYQLVVVAEDSGASPKSSSARVFVTVGNVDDTPPRFATPSFSFLAPDNATVGHLVGIVVAEDPDFPSASPQPISFSATHSTFAVGGSNGRVTTKTTLAAGTSSFDVACRDAAGLSATARVTVRVLPAAEYFAKVPIMPAEMAASVSENSSLWLTVVDVNASINGGAADVGVSYSVVSPVDTFNISAKSGEVTARPNKLDREQRQQQQVMLSAANAAESSYSSTLLLRVQLLDINDNAPRFSLPAAEVSVNESKSVGAQVALLAAADPDTSAAATITYSIVSDTSGGKFRLNASPAGQLVISSPLDYETMPAHKTFALTVSASDGTFSSTQLLTIRVQDANDNSPVFSRANYTFSVREQLAAGAAVGTVATSDRDSLDASGLRFSITGTDAASFRINDTTGGIVTNIVLDWMSHKTLTFNVTCTDAAANAATASVTVTVTDINNNTPNITNLPATWTVPENSSSIGQTFAISVTDPDSGTVTLSLTPASSLFTIAANQLRVAAMLDREAPGMRYDSAGFGLLDLVVTAADSGGRSASASLLVRVSDVNDNPPRFATPAGRDLQRAEALPVGSVILTLDVVDADLPASNSFAFSISPGTNFNGTFAIRGSDLILSRQLQRSTKPQHNLTIFCSDGVFNVSTHVLVTVLDSNNAAPVFSQSRYSFSTAENDPDGPPLGGLPIGTVSASDRDTGRNARIIYAVASPTAFKDIIFIEGNGTVRLNGTIDRETTPSITFSITASDSGDSPRVATAEIVLTVTDVNDNSPAFTAASYSGTVPEASPAGTIVAFTGAPVQATDRDTGNNSFIAYSLVGSDAANFQIDAAGKVSLAAGAALDRETKASYQLQLLATNTRGQPTPRSATSSLTIFVADVNDNSPVFSPSSYSFSIAESAGQFADVGRVAATDADAGQNSSVMFFIVDGGDGRFVLNVTSGQLQLLHRLDRESKAQYQLNVSAVDRGSPGRSSFVSVTVTVVDVNDVAPMVQAATFSVSEERTAPFDIGRVVATDPDTGAGGSVAFFLDAATTSSLPISITATGTAAGTLRATGRLDREAVNDSSVGFLVFARDSGTPALTGSASIVVRLADINDWAPQFSTPNISATLAEKSPVNSVVAVAFASDKDLGDNARVSYSLSGAGSDFFAVDAAGGFIRVAKQITISELLTRSLITRTGTGNNTVYSPLTLQVTAKDNPTNAADSRSSTVPLVINVSPVDDSLPSFTRANYEFAISESAAAGASVGRVFVNMPSGSAFTVSYRFAKESSLFQIDASTGAITVKSGATLDRENPSLAPQLALAVMAFTDSTPSRLSYSLCMVLVTLNDDNDNRPVFSSRLYTFSTREQLATPYNLGQVSATDADASDNAAISYRISSSGSLGSAIEVNASTGHLAVVSALDRERLGSSLRLLIVATDAGVSPLDATATVSLSLSDVNDNAPIIAGGNATASVAEALPGNTQVAVLKATDSDLGLAASISFALRQAESPPMFYIRPDGAGNVTVFTLESLDFETQNKYELEILAFDLGTPSLTSSVTLTVSVTDVDENQPRFARSFNNGSFADNVASGTTVYELSAGSRDFRYSIVSGNTDAAFAINSRGVVSTAKVVAGLATRVFTLGVTATDTLSRSSSTTLQLWLLAPTRAVLLDRAVNLSWPENSVTTRQLLYDFSSVDESVGRTVQYSLASCSPGSCLSSFSIDASTGQLYLVSSLDRETVSRIQLEIRASLPASATSRRRRAALTVAAADSATLTLTVTDVNDNPPVFSVASPYYVGIPVTSPANTLVFTAVATDPDPSSMLTYSLTSSESRFSIGGSSGEVRTRSTFSAAATIGVGVSVSDGNFSRSLQLSVSLVPNDNRVVLTAGVPPATFLTHRSTLRANLSTILGADVRIDKVEASTASGAADPTKTDATLHAFDASGRLLTAADLKARIDAKRAEIAALFAALGMTFEGARVAPTTPGGTATAAGLSGAEIALITIGVLIFIFALIALAVVLWICLRKHKRRVVAETRDAEANGHSQQKAAAAPDPLTAMYQVNPAYRDDISDSQERLVPKESVRLQSAAPLGAAPPASTKLPDSPNGNVLRNDDAESTVSRIMLRPAAYNTIGMSLTMHHHNDDRDDEDEEGNPIIIVNNAPESVPEDAWIAAATNRGQQQPVQDPEGNINQHLAGPNESDTDAFGPNTLRRIQQQQQQHQQQQQQQQQQLTVSTDIDELSQTPSPLPSTDIDRLSQPDRSAEINHLSQPDQSALIDLESSSSSSRQRRAATDLLDSAIAEFDTQQQQLQQLYADHTLSTAL